MVFLMMNTGYSKHVEDSTKWIKTLIWKVCICWFTLHYLISILKWDSELVDMYLHYLVRLYGMHTDNY